jgi:hypothetical protein
MYAWRGRFCRRRRFVLDWFDISLMQDNDKLPLKHVRWLLDMLLDKEPRFPSAWDMHPDASDWERTFRRKRRHLVWPLRTATRLEEDLRCWM